MDLFDRFAGNDSWHTRRLLEYASSLTEEQLDRPLPTVVELLPWREANKTLWQLLENIVFTKEVWTAALTGGDAPKLFEGWELIHAISPDLTLYGIALAYTNHYIKHGT